MPTGSFTYEPVTCAVYISSRCGVTRREKQDGCDSLLAGLLVAHIDSSDGSDHYFLAAPILPTCIHMMHLLPLETERCGSYSRHPYAQSKAPRGQSLCGSLRNSIH